ncbi:hypothetical protein [Noviherbaspirillum aridicola]|uniref:Uncharacterized protein n=1 Tax=Noviherbaspirillum aridicola TaxID=2849687 RepID=A0ABQ4Q947_9BURK|nr:hypothetical protein [Noviherbaspirillum aridicola]GIZ53345.1 hypothetical protein NCCP691_33590 [Noviherbaspirillum aridicola]
MTLRSAKPLLACVLGIAVLAGCASSKSSTPTASAAASGMQKGKIVAVEPASVAGSTMTSPTSGSSATGSTMAGSPSAVVTVQFADGTQSRYSVTQQKTSFNVGDPVSVIMRGDSGVIMKP